MHHNHEYYRIHFPRSSPGSHRISTHIQFRSFGSLSGNFWTFPTQPGTHRHLHLGTLLAVLVYFRQELWRIAKALLNGIKQRKLLHDNNSRLGWYIIVGTIPVATIGLLLEDYFARVFDNPTAAAVFLIITAALLIIAENLLSSRKLITELSWFDAILVGLFQALALLPGISRSGSTITAGIWRGLSRAGAAHYSFLLGVPAIFGAGLLALLEVAGSDSLSSQWPSLRWPWWSPAHRLPSKRHPHSLPPTHATPPRRSPHPSLPWQE